MKTKLLAVSLATSAALAFATLPVITFAATGFSLEDPNAKNSCTGKNGCPTPAATTPTTTPPTKYKQKRLHHKKPDIQTSQTSSFQESEEPTPSL